MMKSLFDSMNYRDMTFCTGDGCAKFDDCPRALTEKEQAAAERWWGGPGAPIAQFMFPKMISCYQEPAKAEGGTQ